MIKTNTVKIGVMSDGTRTVAEVALNNTDLRGEGSSQREHGDKANFSIGEKLATARALRSLAARIERRAKGEVRHAEEIKRHRAEVAAKKLAGKKIRDAQKWSTEVAAKQGYLGRTLATWSAPSSPANNKIGDM